MASANPRHSLKNSYPLNQGDFYIPDGDCTACGAPYSEAPDLIEHGPDNHCYFKKQPSTEQELDQTINAMMVSCTDALRYGGQDEQILKRLYEDGMQGLCDHQPAGEYRSLIRDLVQFDYSDPFPIFERRLIQRYRDMSQFAKIEHYESNTSTAFSFFKRWEVWKEGIKYTCLAVHDTRIMIKIELPEFMEKLGTIGTAATLHDILKKDIKHPTSDGLKQDRENLNGTPNHIKIK